MLLLISLYNFIFTKIIIDILGMAIPVIIDASKSSVDRDIQLMEFGLLPCFTPKEEKPNHYKMFNASKLCKFIYYVYQDYEMSKQTMYIHLL